MVFTNKKYLCFLFRGVLLFAYKTFIIIDFYDNIFVYNIFLIVKLKKIFPLMGTLKTDLSQHHLHFALRMNDWILKHKGDEHNIREFMKLISLETH